MSEDVEVVGEEHDQGEVLVCPVEVGALRRRDPVPLKQDASLPVSPSRSGASGPLWTKEDPTDVHIHLESRLKEV